MRTTAVAGGSSPVLHHGWRELVVMAGSGNFSSPATDDVSIGGFLGSFNASDDSRNLVDLFGLSSEQGGRYPLVPTWVLMMYLIVANGVGVLLNLAICVGYVTQKHKIGVFTLVLHIAISDLLTLTVVSIPEMWSHHAGTWTFGKAICVVYSGCEVFAGTSCIYFLIAMNLHALATANGAKNASSNDSETQLLGEMKSSQHSLVSRSGTSTPTRSNEDDLKVQTSTVPVALPILFVWILSASLSLPEFPLSTIIDSRSGLSSCTLIGGYHLTNMRILLSVFQMLLPFIILSSTSAMIVYKLWTTKEKGEVDLTLKLALFLCCLFLVFSAPRFTLATFYSWWFSDGDDVSGMDRFRSPPLHYQVTPIGVPFVLSFLHFSTPIIKPFAYVYFLLKKDKSTKGSRRRQSGNDAEIS